jgi:hypothetical protein
MPNDCLSCPYAYNAINGLYCSKIKEYVEYNKEKKCDIKKG